MKDAIFQILKITNESQDISASVIWFFSYIIVMFLRKTV